jgi:N-acetyl-D-muramate 6-phosphate phosphatase
MSTPATAILFDLDGTLLDTAPEFTYCLNILLQQENRQTVTVNQLRSIVSFGANGMLQFGFGMTEKDPSYAKLKQQFLDLYMKNIGTQTEFFPGVSNLIQTIESKKIQWGIVTNKPKVFTFALLEKFKLLKLARCVVAGDTLPHQKPDPAPLLFACQTLKVLPQNCWYVGDAKTDAQASQSAGMPCAIASYGYIPQDENPKEWQAQQYLSIADDIAKLF